jgi:hypothetical protein
VAGVKEAKEAEADGMTWAKEAEGFALELEWNGAAEREPLERVPVGVRG